METIDVETIPGEKYQSGIALVYRADLLLVFWGYHSHCSEWLTNPWHHTDALLHCLTLPSQKQASEERRALGWPDMWCSHLEIKRQLWSSPVFFFSPEDDVSLGGYWGLVIKIPRSSSCPLRWRRQGGTWWGKPFLSDESLVILTSRMPIRSTF